MLKELRNWDEGHITVSGVCSFLHPVSFITDYVSNFRRGDSLAHSSGCWRVQGQVAASGEDHNRTQRARGQHVTWLCNKQP